MSVQTSSSGPFTYQWQKANRPLVADSRISGVTSSNLTILNARLQDMGVYHVIVRNADGEVCSHLAILQAGETSLAAWGQNWFGETYVPSKVTNVISLTAWNGILALKADGTLTGWADVGYGNPTNSVPPGLLNLVSLASYYSVIALRNDGTVVQWGDLSQPPAGLKNVVAVQAACDHYLALQSSGTVVEWPRLDTNLISHGYYSTSPAEETNLVAIAANPSGDNNYNIALRNNGSVVGWGSYWLTNAATVPPGLTNVVDIACCSGFFLGIQSNGRVKAWAPGSSQLLATPASWTNILTASGASDGCIALRSDGKILSFGDSYGGTNTPSGLTNVAGLLSAFLSSYAVVGTSSPKITTQPRGRTVVTGSDVTFQVSASGTRPFTYQWRHNGTKISGATNESLVLPHAQASAAGTYGVTLTDRLGTASSADSRLDFGQLLAWGLNEDGLMDIPPGITNVTCFGKDLFLDVRDAVEVGAGDVSYALRSDGTVVICYSSTPTNVPTGLSNVVAISACSDQLLALQADGTVIELTGNQTNLLSNLGSVVAIAAGDLANMALREDGSVVS